MQNASSTNGGAWATDPRARENGTHRRDTCQGVNEVVEALVATGRFEVAYDLRCNDSGQSAKVSGFSRQMHTLVSSTRCTTTIDSQDCASYEMCFV